MPFWFLKSYGCWDPFPHLFKAICLVEIMYIWLWQGGTIFTLTLRSSFRFGFNENLSTLNWIKLRWKLSQHWTHSANTIGEHNRSSRGALYSYQNLPMFGALFVWFCNFLPISFCFDYFIFLVRHNTKLILIVILSIQSFNSRKWRYLNNIRWGTFT